MFGIVGLTAGVILAILGFMYILDYIGLLRKIPGLNVASGHIPKNIFVLILSLVLIASGAGMTLGDVTETVNSLESQSTTDTYGADINLIVAGTAGAAFADSGFEMYLLDYETYSGSNANAILQDVIDSGTGGLVSPEGTTATPDTVTSGLFTWQDQVAKIGDKFVVWGYDDETPAAGDYETFFEIIEIVGFNAEQGTFTVTPNRYQLYTFGAVDSYNFASTDITGYTEDADSATAGMTISFDLYSDADNNISKDMGLFIELPSAMQSQINKITVTNDDGLFAETSSFLDTSILGIGNKFFESAPAKQTAGNSIYYVSELPNALRTSTTAKDKINVELDYDHLGTGSNLIYIYAVQMVSGGSDIHFDIAANPAFALNATADGTDGWTA